MQHTLPAGLMPSNDITGEFFACHNGNAYKLTNGGTVAPDGFSPVLRGIVEAHMAQHPAKVQGIRQMGITEPLAILNQYLVCNYGKFDNTPDIINGVMQEPEYWACPKRGTCGQDGIVCTPLKAANGETFTPTELAILKRIAEGELDKEIAHHMRIAESTVATHTRNIRKKTGMRRKADFTRFATLNQLI